MQIAIRNSLIIFILFLVLPIHTYATVTDENREEILEFVKGAFQAQVALSEKERSIKEVQELLSPYLTASYMELFLTENLVEENGKYFTLGSDFALYYIPFFSYNENTKIITHENQIYVYEFFPGNQEGPVTYQDHYEGIVLEAQNGQYKVARLLDKAPDEAIHDKETNETNAIKVTQKEQPPLLTALLFSRLSAKKPIEFFIELRSYFK